MEAPAAMKGHVRARPNVQLISMPWTVLAEPSLGLAILKAQLNQEGIPSTVSHLNLFLLDHLKPESYEACASLYAFNDFLFSRELEQQEAQPDQLEALKAFTTKTYDRVDLQARARLEPAKYVEFALRMRDEIVPQYLDECMEYVRSVDATMIGFTCMFDQTVASLALARRIRAEFPDKLIVFGGYAIQEPVGSLVQKCFPYVDVMAYGEGERIIGPLAWASVNRSLLVDIPGITYRDPAGALRRSTVPVRPIDMDESPTPDFDDWYYDTALLDAEYQVRIETEVLPVESSRGCWWGQVSHCVFCGIDDESMKYRAKSSAAVKKMLMALRAKYGMSNFRFSDYIMPRQYLKTLLPELIQEDAGYLLHWEMKANMRHADVKTMHEAGIDRIQPGIESFSTSVLEKMDKGVRGIQNILTIRMLMEHDINVYYNILYGFPSDTVEEYREMSARIPSLYHLKPPGSYVPVLTTRYAPLQQDPARFGITKPLAAESRYNMIFSEAYRREIGFDLADYCYVFETPYDIRPELQEEYDILVYQLFHWFSLGTYRTVELSYDRSEDGITFVDSRFQSEPIRIDLGPDHAAVHELICHRVMSHGQLLAALDGTLNMDRVESALNELLEARLVYQEAHRYVALALPKVCYERWALLPDMKPILAWI